MCIDYGKFSNGLQSSNKSGGETWMNSLLTVPLRLNLSRKTLSLKIKILNRYSIAYTINC